MDALMGLLLNDATSSGEPKEKVNAFIINDKGDDLEAYLLSLEKSQKEKLLSNSITKFGENIPLRLAIHNRSWSCIRTLILCGADVGLADGAKAILARNFLLFQKEDDAELARIILQSYQGPLTELPFASAPPPGRHGTCFAMIARSHSSAWRLLPILALKGLTPVTTADHDDMAILAQAAETRSEPTPSNDGVITTTTPSDDRAPIAPSTDVPSSTGVKGVSLRQCVYEWLDAYYSTQHHISLKNLCRIVVRREVRVPDEKIIDQLHLPNALKDYLLLRLVN